MQRPRSRDEFGQDEVGEEAGASSHSVLFVLPHCELRYLSSLAFIWRT